MVTWELLAGIAIGMFLGLLIDTRRLLQRRDVTQQNLELGEPEADSDLPYLPDFDSNTGIEDSWEVSHKQELEEFTAPESGEIKLDRAAPLLDLSVLGNGENDRILVHTDFDGLVSGAILLRILGAQADLHLGGPRSLRSAITRASQGMTKGDRLFIADIGCNYDLRNDVAALLQTLKGRGCEIYWYDHHAWSPQTVGLIQSSCRDLIIDRSFNTAAEITRLRLTKDDPYFDRIIDGILKHRPPPPEYAEWISGWILILRALTGARDFESQLEAVHKLAFEKEFTLRDRLLIRSGHKNQQFEQEIMVQPNRRETTGKQRKLLIIDARTFQLAFTPENRKLLVIQHRKPSNSIATLLLKQEDNDLVLILWSNSRCSLYRARSDFQTDLRILDGTWSLGKTEYQARLAHANILGIRYRLTFTSRLRQLWSWHPPREFEQLVNKIQSTL